MLIEELNSRFASAGGVRFAAGSGGFVHAVVSTPFAEGHVYLHGAHVTHYQPAGTTPVLFTSPHSQFAPGKAIRGGVPVIFPWFGPRAGHPAAPEHGFARVAEWSVESVERALDGAVILELRLDRTETTRTLWPYDFSMWHRVRIGPRLELELEVENRSHEPFGFEEALHTYLRVGDVREATVSGLAGTTYIDKTDAMKRKVQADEPLRLSGATDRVFLGTRGPCVVDDPVLDRRLVIEKRGSATTVVWNPWHEKAAAMADLGGEVWPWMLCVETANAADDAVRLAPGQRHRMTAVVGAESRRVPSKPG
jgi:glucose-6-phosphate 1-epimerase